MKSTAGLNIWLKLSMTSLAGSHQWRLLPRGRVFPRLICCLHTLPSTHAHFLSVRAASPVCRGRLEQNVLDLKAAERDVRVRHGLDRGPVLMKPRAVRKAPTVTKHYWVLLVSTVRLNRLLLFQEAGRPPEPGSGHAPPVRNVQRRGEDGRQQDRRVPRGCSLPTQVSVPVARTFGRRSVESPPWRRHFF